MGGDKMTKKLSRYLNDPAQVPKHNFKFSDDILLELFELMIIV